MSSLSINIPNCQSILSNINSGLILINAESQILIWNDWIAKRSGISSEIALGQSLELLFGDGMALSFKLAIQRIQAQKFPIIISNALHVSPLPLYHLPFTDQNQSRIHQSITITPICEMDDFCYLIQIVDTSMWIKRERVLKSHSEQLDLLSKQMRERGNRMHALFDQASVGIAEVDTESGRFLQANQKFVSIIGYSVDELFRLDLKSISYFDDIAPYHAQMDKIGQGGLQEFVMEMRIFHKNGSIIWVEIAVSVIRVNDPVTGKHMILMRNITESKLMAAKLLREENWHNGILASVSQGIISTSLDGVIHTFNQAAEKMLGYCANDVVDKVTPAIFHDPCEVVERAKIFSQELGVQIEPGFDVFVAKSCKGLPNEHEWTYIRKDGTRFPVLLSVSAIKNCSNDIIGYMGLAKDISSERKQREIDAQTFLHEKTVLLNEVHHRVKNNLQIISSLLRMEANRSALPDVKYSLMAMQTRVRSMALLHESLYQSGTFASVDVGAYIGLLASQSFDALREPSSPVKLRLNVASLRLGIDQATPIGLLVNELISNSIKHGFPNGRPGEICIELQPEDGSSQWRLQVSDTGVGLPKDFDASRLHSMGLRLVSDLTMQIGGVHEIGLGPGAVFIVVFKAREYGVRPD